MLLKQLYAFTDEFFRRGRSDNKPLLTISYIGKGRVPVVAHVPGSSITFREFRKSLGISSRSNMQ